jgi:hypothetical protein
MTFWLLLMLGILGWYLELPRAAWFVLFLVAIVGSYAERTHQKREEQLEARIAELELEQIHGPDETERSN